MLESFYNNFLKIIIIDVIIVKIIFFKFTDILSGVYYTLKYSEKLACEKARNK